MYRGKQTDRLIVFKQSSLLKFVQNACSCTCGQAEQAGLLTHMRIQRLAMLHRMMCTLQALPDRAASQFLVPAADLIWFVGADNSVPWLPADGVVSVQP